MSRAGSLKVRVVEVVRETAEAHTLVLEPAEGDRERFAYRPGQFLTIRVPAPDGWAARCYSLCSSPLTDEHLKVTVKRVAGGLGSNWICDNVTAGDVLEVLRPAGTFTPSSLQEDLLLIAGGSGITPIMSILKSCLAAGGGKVTLLYANRDERSVIFAGELRALAEAHGERLTVLHWLESVQGLPTAAGLRALLRPYTDRDAFICGPAAFMDLATEALTGLGVPAGRVHVEKYFSLAGDPFEAAGEDAISDGDSGAAGEEDAATVEVEIDGERRTVPWPRSERLLDVLLRAGVDAPFSCREGSCAACACVVLEGEASMDVNTVLDERDLADGLILACQARPVSDRLKVTYDG
ncbi:MULTISPECIES: ferredoxin--NADP reductase [Thermomonospora]|uniref:3-ketosteroid-9-alpha-monooxygenase, ferredoxin reductase component n=1 Tax=Thermomonospora curvata (strain ATCC 19995 / DSM 43183 / JCM 3096 / KCTC 9072 / NBRC 15933 / NCIMB 10081 / Henssen B9) TaxID=471852 RepID=D1ABN3_THECD|nr:MULTISPECIES: ferredoxin--NADP reductase [Thermomonospora]ACY99056.1 ferredoxin [Thermomonospora curvata DSM 43183]PKK13240.1 MAG: 3-ketosteroid-9-alpha-hydroxylase [Thermomonospora sp. CIF 1]